MLSLISRLHLREHLMTSYRLLVTFHGDADVIRERERFCFFPRADIRTRMLMGSRREQRQFGPAPNRSSRRAFNLEVVQEEKR